MKTNPISSLLAKTLSCVPITVLATGLILSLLPAQVTYAATFAVTKTADTNDGACDADCSLREAIIAANSNPGHDTITIPSGTYTLTIAGTNEEAAATGDLDITSDMTITGAGAATTIIDGGGLDRVLQIIGTITVSISDLTISNGQSEFAVDGGGIYNSGGKATLANSIVSGNLSRGQAGGIYNPSSGIMTVTNSSIVNNSARFQRAGFHNLGVATLISTTVSENTTFGFCGGICNSGGTLALVNSTVVSNTTSGQGGGILNENGGTMTLTNTSVISNAVSYSNGGGIATFFSAMYLNNVTVSGNRASGRGGGLYVNGGPVTLNNGTITNNTADSDGDGSGDGGGIYNAGTFNFSNTIVAGNRNTSGQAPDSRGTLTSQDYNLIQSTNGCGITGSTAHNLTGVSPNLGPLQDNGGPNFTHALPPASPAIDIANPAAPGSGGNACEGTDQRGIARPQGMGCDMGAYELEVPLTPLASVAISGPTLGTANTVYAFVATVSPITAKTPVTYVWRATGQSPVTNTGELTHTVTFTWSTSALQAITITAANVGSTVTDTHTILISTDAQTWTINLPLVMRNFRPPVLLDIPPRDYEQPDSCGEVCVQEALLYYGRELSQLQINQAGGGDGVIGLWSSGIEKALDNLHAGYNSWRLTSPDYSEYIGMLKSKLDQGHPILVGVKLNPSSHPDWFCDHFILLIGYDSDSFIFNSPSARSQRSFIQFRDGDAPDGTGLTLTNPYGYFFGVEFTGP